MEEQSVHSSTSDINSEEAAATEPLIIPRKKRICLVGSTGEDPALGAAAQQFSVPVLKSEQGTEYVEDTTYCTYYILSKFEGADYDTLHKTAHRILGPTALLQLAEKKESLPSINRPMYTQSMLGTIVVFTGFRKKEELTRLINMIHNMGGSIRKDMGNKVTHLIANCCGGDKYRYAITFRIPIMSSDWVLELWNARDDVASSSSNDKLIADYKLKPFFGAKVCFFGFPDDEKTHMYEVLQQQGGEPAEIDDPNCTHVVVDESNVNSLPDLASVRAHIVKAEWFWTSVQNEGAAYEKDYLFEDYLESVMSPMAMARRDSQAATPRTASTKRKRKRMAETLCSLVQNGADSPAVHKRRSSISDAGHLSVSGSFLDCTSSPDKQLDAIPEVEAVSTEAGRKNLSPRHQVFLELVTTESNYVGILSTIMTLFKEPLEDLIEMSGELLNSTEAKIIFGNFPPIYEVHKKMLEELRYNASHWAEDVSIGNIFLKYAPDLVKAYPPYVNFFENTKEMLDQCDQNKPRFHAFLKICQTKPECGRQSLKELLIKPVQRLPSISLLLNDILKHTSKSNPDHSALELSISSIKEVMTYINEDKRKTEGQLVMFDIFNDIDNCPAHLVSSHRSFIGKCEVMELGEGLSGRGDHLVLFLFTDTLEICKKRSKAFNSLKSPKEANGLHPTKLSQGKPYKHIRMLSLSTIKKVVDIRETDECQKVFALMVRSNQELKEKLFSFTITDEEVNKTNYLRTLCRQMANSVCKADADTFLISLDSHQLEIDTSDVALGTLSKAFKSLFHNFYLEYMDPYVFLLNSMCETTLHVPLPFASRTRMKVGRAFSFNKTPSKLKRAMSTMMSPFGSTNSLTPASQQLAQMRLASCNNINELGNGGSGSPTRDEVLVAPMSVQPTRKAKCSSLSMASLRRNCSEEVVQDKSEL
ncbi:protein ECT2 isoform X12 [Neodiprion pinetum]|uniref:Protein ECT2 isoform X12 n=2 Tax=Neodiprion TaxID=270857 RepID=A0A6J0C6E5_NEOLC|nr:protein ECT2 isoform X12 [Neodiprion lecontei]XP_046428575.1 protein ECT2 isoform X1 [Neodiprion fabricii]XP_046428576.1 protein ECT2 isoform X1 [Neodiprion fabricii]XP_046485341.1 protein ECT2 isoform X12 [Neodiprion pinetum]XP_046622524.1 protein ECT2 isoform X12 [Neodiprion virginianus]